MKMSVVSSMGPTLDVGTGMSAEKKDLWVLRQKATTIHTWRSYHKGCASP